MPVHTHSMQVDNGIAALGTPSSDVILARSVGGNAYSSSIAQFTNLAPQALAPAGGSQPHNNMQPYLTMNFIIALQGVFPPRP
jgi:microcystin-dependent protein